MPLDTEMARLLREFEGARIRSPHELSPDEARAELRRRRAMARTEALPMADVHDEALRGPAGPLQVRIYRPLPGGPLPILVYLHGGGWVTGDLDTQDFHCRAFAHGARCVVLSVDYRLAPENKFPAAPEDCYAALEWAAANAHSLQGDVSRVAVGGASAGGNLAAAVTLMARDRGGPSLRYQMLLYPVTDFAFDTPSYQANSKGYLLSRADMEWYWGHYLASPEDGAHPYASPARVGDLRRLPAAYVAVAEYDPLRDEGEAYANKLRAGGVPVTLRRHAGLTHGFAGMTYAVRAARVAMDEAVEALAQALN